MACAGSSEPLTDYGDSSAAAGTGSGGAGSSGASGSTATGGNGSTTVSVVDGSGQVSSLSFAVTTAAQGGKYSPKNVGAIWIEDSSGAYVRSLEVWAGIRKHDLTSYRSALGSNSDADVTTSATLSQHRTHHVSWDLKDVHGNAVTAGKYKLIVDLTDRDGDGASMSVDFDTSAGAQTITPGGSTYYSAMSLLLE